MLLLLFMRHYFAGLFHAADDAAMLPFRLFFS